ncbi:RNA polymerase II transcription elongation factor SpEAF [Cystobasidiomycetes sp. EMM_F5]
MCLPPPPASPYRRNSQADMSEEVAALEKELIRPEYRQNKPLSRLNIDTDFPQNAHSSLHTASGPQPASGLRQRASSTAASPFPVTFRSPASTSRQTGADHNAPPILPESPFPVKLQSNASFASTSAAEIGEDTDKSIASPEKRTPSAPPFALNSYPVPYPPSLPPLPEYFLKQRPGLGGLAKKKRERTLVQSANPSAPLPAMNSDLYRLGVSRAQYGGVRSLVGAAAPMPGRTRGGGKVVMSTDWQVAVSELRTQKAMERIEQLKSDKTWSFRQLRKQRGPGTHKAHWDYLLDEMRWMAVDVRQETRWKIASAYAMSQEIKRWHEAGTPEARSALSIRRREVMQRDTSEVPLLPQPSDLGQSIDVDMTVEPPPESHASSQDDVKPQPENPPQRGPVMVALDAAQTATSRGRSGHIESPKFKKRAQAVMLARMPMFEENALKTVFDLSQAKFSHAHASFAISDIVHELLQDIPAYAPPPQPSDDPRTNRRIEESNPISSRITNTSHLLESKPLLVSTLHPSKKRKRSGDWQDLTSLASGLTEERSTLPSMFGTEQGWYSFSLSKQANTESAQILLSVKVLSRQRRWAAGATNQRRRRITKPGLHLWSGVQTKIADCSQSRDNAHSTGR